MKEVRLLGVIIGPERIKIEEKKVKDVLDWPTLQGVKDVQKFLKLANYYYQFIKNFTMIARLLHDMVKKDKKWKWTERQKEAFRKLKKKFMKEPILVALDLDKKMRMKVDTSDYATGEVLSMECGDRQWRPEVFLSKSLNEIERNYDKEILAVIRGLENWRHLLKGAKFKFEV